MDAACMAETSVAVDRSVLATGDRVSMSAERDVGATDIEEGDDNEGDVDGVTDEGPAGAPVVVLVVVVVVVVFDVTSAVAVSVVAATASVVNEEKEEEKDEADAAVIVPDEEDDEDDEDEELEDACTVDFVELSDGPFPLMITADVEPSTFRPSTCALLSARMAVFRASMSCSFTISVCSFARSAASCITALFISFIC